MTYLTIRLLGPFEVTVGGKPVFNFESDKVRALLAYLVVESDRPHSRETLADFLWPDRPPGAGLSNLRHALTILRRAIADRQATPPLLLVSRQSIQFNTSANIWVDIYDFSQKIAQSEANGGALQALDEAVALVRGSFLEGLSAGDSPALEEWLFLRREQILTETLQGLFRMATYAELKGEIEQALDYARRQVELAPWQERAYQQLMRLLALSGRRSDALAQFEVCRRRLAEELDVTPAQETVALYQRIRDGEFKPPLSELGRSHIRGYELGECIGVGHVGAVFRAYQPVVDREVAIKLILPQLASRPDFIRRFEAEARRVARLEHPHIVPLYDFWREPKGAYLVMRWLRGGSLRGSLAEGPWSAERGARLVDQIGAALAAAHLQGVVHRDVKPANILLDEAGNGYLSDFGVATLAETVDGWEPHPTSDTSGSLAYISPETAQGGTVTAATDVYSLGVVIFELLIGRHPFPGLSPQELIHKHLTEPLPKVSTLRPELPAAVDEVIQQATAKSPEDRYPNTAALAQALHRALGLSLHPSLILAQEAGIPRNPYRGLQPFREADAPYFFGREEMIRQLIARLAEVTEGARFLAVVGPSGIGKSSLIGAGLLPALRAGAMPGSEKWFVVNMLPGTRPLEELALGLLGVAPGTPPDLMAILSGDEKGLLEAAELVLPDAESELLLVVDQFEALFDGAVCQEEREQLLGQINTAVNSPGTMLRVIIGLRADFYDRPLAFPGYSHLMGRRTETVGPLSADELVRAIEGPANKVGVVVEPGLVARIVADVNSQTGTLPMLQYALTELFERRQGWRLDRQAYQELGGISGALVHRAESLYGGLDPDEKRVARQLFLRLVSLGEGSQDVLPAPVARRRVLRAELESLHDTGEESKRETAHDVNAQIPGPIRKVIETFGAARLLTFDRDPATRAPTLEVAHEALLWEWPRLTSWLEESRDQMRSERLLARAASEWSASGQDPSFLLRGARLDQFEQWASTTDLALTEEERHYLDEALGQRTERRAAEKQRMVREEALEQRSRNFLRALAGVLAVATLVALSLAAFAFDQRRRALEAYSLSLIASAQEAMQNQDPATALLLAQAANQIADPPLEARRTLMDAAYAPGARRRYEVSSLFQGLRGPATSLAISPDGQSALVGLAEGVVVFWDWSSGAEIYRLSGHTASVNDITFAPDGRTALSAADDGLVIQWDLETGLPVWRLAGHLGPVKTVDISHDGRLAVSGGHGGDSFRDPGRLILWDLANGQEIRRFEGHKSGLVEAEFALGDTAILASSGDAELITDLGVESPGQELQVETILWDAGSGAILARPASFEHDAYSLAISSDGQQALIGSYYNNVASLVDLPTGETLRVLEGHRDAVSVVHISADGRWAVTGSHDGSLILWDLASGEIKVQLRVHRGEVADVAVTPDGRSALSATRDGELISWDLYDAMDADRFLGHGDMVYDVAHLPDGKRFISISGGPNPAVNSKDTSVRLWDIASGRQLRSRDLPLEVLFQVEVTPDGQMALIAGMAPDVIMLDAETLDDIGRLKGHEGWVTAVDISPDGRQAVTTSVQGSLILWDLVNRRIIRKIETSAPGGLWSVAISPDGRSALADTDEGIIGLWDLETGLQRASFVIEGLTGQQGTSGIAFLADGRSAIAAGNNGLIFQWDLESGELIRILGQHSDIRTRIEIAPDGRLALSSGMDGALMLWDLEEGELIRRFGLPGQIIFDIDMSPDGTTALSGSSDASIVLWHLQNPSARELDGWIAANRIVRAPSCEERELYQIGTACPADRPGQGLTR
jgi:WD40 repeat protein/DNA-binding SARP family transcriptional activator